MAKLPPEPGATHALALVSVPFEGTQIEAALNGEAKRTIWVSVRRVSDAIGVDMGGQLRRLKGRHWATVEMKSTVAEDGKAREVAMVDVDTLAMWLATIEPARVKESARPLLVAYQRRAARVLREHFFPHAGAAPAQLPAPTPSRDPPEPPELAAAAELLGGIDPRVRAALRRLPPPRRPTVEHWIGQARELSKLVDAGDAPLPLDTLTCARLAASLIVATSTAPEHPLTLGTREDLPRTMAVIERLLIRAACDVDLQARVTELRARWSEVSAPLR